MEPTGSRDYKKDKTPTLWRKNNAWGERIFNFYLSGWIIKRWLSFPRKYHLLSKITHFKFPHNCAFKTVSLSRIRYAFEFFNFLNFKNSQHIFGKNLMEIWYRTWTEEMARLTAWRRGIDPEDEYCPPRKNLRYEKRKNFLEIYATSFICGCSAEFATYPLDLVKTRMQVQGYFPDQNMPGYTYRNPWATFKGVVQEEGLRKLYAGISAQVVRHIFFGGTKFIIFDALSQNLETSGPNNKLELSYPHSCFCAIIAGGCANLVTVPTELFKIRMQMEAKRRAAGFPPRINNVVQGLTSTIQKNGFSGLWAGVVPTMWRGALHTLGELLPIHYMVSTFTFFSPQWSRKPMLEPTTWSSGR